MRVVLVALVFLVLFLTGCIHFKTIAECQNYSGQSKVNCLKIASEAYIAKSDYPSAKQACDQIPLVENGEEIPYALYHKFKCYKDLAISSHNPVICENIDRSSSSVYEYMYTDCKELSTPPGDADTESFLFPSPS